MPGEQEYDYQQGIDKNKEFWGNVGAKFGNWGFTPMTGLSVGANLLGSLLSIYGERKRRREMAGLQREALRPLEDRMATLSFGPSEAEGGLMRGVVDRTIRGLADRGMLDSNIAAGEIAGAIAPVQAQGASERRGLERDIASAKFQIAATEAAPGYSEAFGGALGETGGFLALMEGIRQGGSRTSRTREQQLRDLFDLNNDEELGDTSDLFSNYDRA